MKYELPLYIGSFTTVSTVVNEPTYDGFSYSFLILKISTTNRKGEKRLLLLAHAYTRFSSGVKTEQAEVLPLYVG